MQKGVERTDALAQTCLKTRPLLRGNDARHDVERNQPLLTVRLAIDRESDPRAMKGDVCGLAFTRNEIIRHGFEPTGITPVIFAYRTVSGIHFVISSLHNSHLYPI